MHFVEIQRSPHSFAQSEDRTINLRTILKKDETGMTWGAACCLILLLLDRNGVGQVLHFEDVPSNQSVTHDSSLNDTSLDQMLSLFFNSRDNESESGDTVDSEVGDKDDKKDAHNHRR